MVNLLDSLDGQRGVEFVRQIAAVIPIKVLCDLLGVPLEDEERILHWTNLMVGVNDPDLSTGPAESFAAFMEVFAYGKWLVEKRRQEPQDDLISMVAHGRLDGEPLDDRSRGGMCATLIAAGNETTRNAITASVQLLSKAPDERTRLVGDPALVGMAVEEFLRRATPLIHMMRTAKEDLEVAGQIIAKGEHVAMLYGAANHDPSVFPDPTASILAVRTPASTWRLVQACMRVLGNASPRWRCACSCGSSYGAIRARKRSLSRPTCSAILCAESNTCRFGCTKRRGGAL